MKYKKSIILIMLTIFLFAIAAASASDVNETVMANEDTGQMELSTNDETISSETGSEILTAGQYTYSDLRYQIGSGGNITLTEGTYTYNNDGDTIEITDSGVIDGNGAVIDMAGSNIQAFNVVASDVTIKNLCIKNANFDGYGGAIHFNRTGSVTNCNFTNNTASREGGAVFFRLASNVTNCNFVDNTAGRYGGAINFDDMSKGSNVTNCNFAGNTAYEEGGALFFSGTGIVTNCNFDENSASEGGAIYFYDYANKGPSIVANCNFTSNNASNKDGAVYFYRSGNVTNCNFVNNTADGDGGAIYFYNLDSEGTAVTNCNFTDNKAGYGGALGFRQTGSVANCNFINNTATGGSGGAIYFYDENNRGSAAVTNCNFTDNNAFSSYSYGGAVYFYRNGTVTNCNFANSTAYNGDGGAVYFAAAGSVTCCNFTDNQATGFNSCGGAVYFAAAGSVTCCNFTDNQANGSNSCGGAVYFAAAGSVTCCNFTDNQATGFNSCGGAVYFGAAGSVTICNFVKNSASRGWAIFSNGGDTVADTCIFKSDSGHNVNTEIRPPTLNVGNFTTVYGSGEKLKFNLKTNSGIRVADGIISIGIYFKNNNSQVGEYSCLSGEEWAVDLPVGSYYAIFNTEYEGFEEINRTITITIPDIKYYVNVSSVTTDNKTVNITAKSNIPEKIFWDGKLLFLVPNADPVAATYAGNGTWWALHTFGNCGEFEVNASFVGAINVTVNNATITINKMEAQFVANPVTSTYNVNNYLVITLTDVYGNPLSGEEVTVDLGGVKAYTTDNNGQIRISTKSLAAKSYDAKITFNSNDFYVNSSKVVKVTVNKAANPLKVKAKTVTVKFSKLKKKAQKLKVTKVVKFTKKGQGTLTYKKVKGNKKITINKKTGKVTIKKGLKKGTYKVKMKIKTKGNANYKASAFKTITFKIKIK